MTVLRYHPHEGVAGATATAAAEGYTTSAGTAIYTSGGVVGSTSVRYDAGAVEHHIDDVTGGSHARIWFRTSTLTGDTTFLRANAGATALSALRRTATGSIASYSGLGTKVDETAAGVVVAGAWYRVEQGVGSSAQEVRVYNLAGALLDTLTGAAAAGTVSRWFIGHAHTGVYADATDIDAVSLGDTWLGAGIPPSDPAAELAAHRTRAAITPNRAAATLQQHLMKASL